MEYKGKHRIFDITKVNTYPLMTRKNRVTVAALLTPERVLNTRYEVSRSVEETIDAVAKQIVTAYREHKPIIVFVGAHLVKNGLGYLVTDLMKRGLVSLFASNAAGAIHDFELALLGETSEVVPNGLPKGTFGMAYEFCFINEAIRLGNQMRLGLGESLGRMILDDQFREEVLRRVARPNSPTRFRNPDKSVLAVGYQMGIPVTIHVTIGTDVIDQHPNFDPESKGGTSGRDFMIMVDMVSRMTNGGVELNIGSAVTGPEVFLKAVSISANVGRPPDRIITADFDIRPHEPDAMTNEASVYYYYRDQKSVVTRIPEAFHGKGFYVQGDQHLTIPLLYQKIINLLG